MVTGVKKCGDMNGDGLIGTEDALTVLKMIVKLVPRSEAKELIGDVNGDGVLDVTDAEHILFRIVGIIDHFKVETGW